MQVKFNSWDQKYKIPFGAIKKANKVTFLIEVDSLITAAKVWLTKDRETPVSYEMTKQGENSYQVQIEVDSPGLYWYYFEIDRDNETLYLAKDQLGQGKLANSSYNIPQFQLTCYKEDVPTVDWYTGGMAYQIFPDSFSNGNKNRVVFGAKRNSFIYATHEDDPYYVRNRDGSIARWSFYGGNLKGIREAIPYLKSLGVTAVYLNPIFSATSNHRYDTNDYFKIDSMLGDERDFKDLVEELHQNNIGLILDGVFNHVGVHSEYFQKAINDPASHYRKWFKFSNYPTDYSSWWGIKDLPEVDKDNPEYQQIILGDQGVLDKWTKLGADGWRLDVADELPMDFLVKIRQRLEKDNSHVLIGEVWEDASKKFVNNERRKYIKGDNLTGVMNYPARNFILNLLSDENYQDQSKEINSYLELVENYPRSFMRNCLNNIGTHDTKRIKTLENNNEKLVALAFGIMFMLPGVPSIYYGDEAGLIGDKDPDNRRFFPWGKESKFLQQKVQTLSKIRKTNSAITDGDFGIIHFKNGLISLVCYDDRKVVVYSFNRSKDLKDIKLDEAEILHINDEVLDKIKDEWGPEKLDGQSDNFQFFKLK